MNARTTNTVVLTASALLLSVAAVERAWGSEPAPVPRAVVPAEAAPETMSAMFESLESGDRTITIDGAQWLQVQFSDYDLGEGGQLTISSEDDEQTFNQSQLEAWEGLSAVFNGSEITIRLTAGPSGEISAGVGDIIIGLPGATTEVGLENAGPLIELLGTDFERFIPSDEPRQPDRPVEDMDEDIGAIESICGPDDRIGSNHPASGRIMPIGCTGWIIQGGRLLTAGHCIDNRTRTVEFNVPASRANGAPVSPPVRHQYRVISNSIVDQYTGVGNDWAVFEVSPNTQTGQMPIDAQGDFFTVSNTANPGTVRITGYGVDGPAPNHGNPPPRNSDNQTQQTHNGALTENTGGANQGILRYTVDTQGGNSGSPVMVDDGSNQTIGIHTNGGCTPTGGANAGTSFRNQALFAAIQVQPQPPTLTLVDTNPRKLKRGQTTQVVATLTQGGAPMPGVTVSFSSSDTSRATVAPATATTDATGKATATVTGQSRSRSSAGITASASGQTAQVTVHVPDLSAVGLGLMLIGLLFFGTTMLGRRSA